jgi:hypothetical protein
MKFVTNLPLRTAGLSLLPLLALACGSSSPKPAPPAEPPPVAAAPPQPEPAPKPAAPEPPPIPEAPPPLQPGPPKPHVSKALAFLPPDAQAVIGFDVPRIASTPLGDKFRQAFLGASLPKQCESLNAGQFGNIVLGAGGGGKVVVVLDGKLPERGMVACLEAGVKAKGAKAEVKTVAGHKLHYVTGSSDDNGWITWTKNAVVMANSEAALTQALDAKATKLAGDLAQLSLQVDHSRMVWAAGIIPVAHLAAFGIPADVVGGPVSVRASVDIAGDTDIDVVLSCATPDAAAALANAMRPLVGQLRSAPNTAPLVANLKLGVHGKDIHAMAKLDAELTRKLIDAMNVK